MPGVVWLSLHPGSADRGRVPYSMGRVACIVLLAGSEVHRLLQAQQGGPAQQAGRSVELWRHGTHSWTLPLLTPPCLDKLLDSLCHRGARTCSSRTASFGHGWRHAQRGFACHPSAWLPWCREVRGAPQAAGSQGQGSRPSREQSRDGQPPGKADPQEGEADSPVTARGGFLSPLGRSVVTALEAELDQVQPCTAVGCRNVD